jgi:hypothetical protein
MEITMRIRIPDMPPGAAEFVRDELTELVIHSTWLPDMSDAQKAVIETSVLLAFDAEMPGVKVQLHFHPLRDVVTQRPWTIIFVTKGGDDDLDERGIWHKDQEIIDAYVPRIRAIRDRSWNSGHDLAQKLVRPHPHKREVKSRAKAASLKQAA